MDLNNIMKHGIRCHMVVYVTMIAFLMTLLGNKFTDTLIATYFFIQPLVIYSASSHICNVTSS